MRNSLINPTSLLFLLAVAISAVAPATLAQDVELSSPLDGYVRLGRAAAVRVSAEGLSASRLTISGDGVVPVQLPVTAGRVEATIPLISQGVTPDVLHWQAGQASGTAAMQVRSLGTDDRLVAVATEGGIEAATAFAAELFDGRKTVIAKLDTSLPRLLWPPQAYDAADAVLLDPSSAARVDEAQLRVLLAGGTTVAIHSPTRPVGQWPWQQQGAWWVLRYQPVGPHGGVNVEAYAPTYAWDRSWPVGQRQTLLLLSALSAMLLIGATLWRGRGGFVAATVVCVCSTAAVSFYVLSLKPAVTAGGDVVVWDGHLGQRDRWTYVSAFRDANLSVEAQDRTRPVLGTRRQMASLGLTLTCDPTGAPDRFEFALAAKNTIAFVTRSVSPSPPADSQPDAQVPMDLIADRLYPGHVAEQTAATPSDAVGEWWGAVVMHP